MNTDTHKITTKVFTLRINSALIEQIKKRAIINKRSSAKEIEFILEQYLENQN